MSENYEDLAIPEIKLIQGTFGDDAKRAEAKIGDFYCSMTGEIIPGTEGFDIVVAGPAHKTRTYWRTTEITEDLPKCQSNDGITSIAGNFCKIACPYGVFNDAPYLLEGTALQAVCTPNYHIFAIKLSDMMPLLIRCSGISCMAAKELNTLLKFHKNIRGGQFYKAKIHVTSVKKKTPSGEAYAIKFGDPQLMDSGMQTEAKEAMAQLSSANVLPESEILG